MSNPVLIDAAVPLYAFGQANPLKGPCRAFLDLVTSGDIEGYASTEMIQEFVHHRLRATKDPSRAVKEARDLRLMVTIFPFNDAVLNLALDLIASPTRVRGRDAVHAATALLHGLDRIITPDHAFDSVPGLTRVDPRDWPGPA